jgi:hypothetical protein
VKDDTKHLDDGGGFGMPGSGGNERGIDGAFPPKPTGVGTEVSARAFEQEPEPEIEGPYEYTIKLQVGLTAQKLVAAFGDSAPDDVRTLIVELEQEVGLWALTILLGRYFECQMSIAKDKCPELFYKTDAELVKELSE